MPLQQSSMKWLATIAISAVLSGCATNPDGSTNDQQATVTQGAAFGAIMGGLLGAAVSDNRGRGALIGAAAGGVIGAGVGNSIAQRKAEYANEEDFLVEEIRRNQEFTQEADAQNDQLRQEIAQLDRESRQLERRYRAGKASRDALTQQKTRLEKQLAKAKQINSLAEQQLADTNQVYQESRQKRGPRDQYTQKLESNLVDLKETRQQSNQNVSNLQRIYDSMSI
ncbi:MAG: glycine zipper 2TM domain-containing protein [Phycisphaerales bacterium]|nr:glycine zipper 2TM domain-containing protein [Phycisphaerales bacterium]